MHPKMYETLVYTANAWLTYANDNGLISFPNGQIVGVC